MYLHGCVFFSFFKINIHLSGLFEGDIELQPEQESNVSVLFKLNELFLIFARDF